MISKEGGHTKRVSSTYARPAKQIAPIILAHPHQRTPCSTLGLTLKARIRIHQRLLRGGRREPYIHAGRVERTVEAVHAGRSETGQTGDRIQVHVHA